MTRIVSFWPFLELITGAGGATGETEMVARTAARSPPPTRAGGQDDGSYTNSLKLKREGLLNRLLISTGQGMVK